MPNWKQAVDQFFKHSDPEGGFFHCAEDGVGKSKISQFEKKLNIKFPDELREFYSNYNGIGLTNDEEEYPNFIPPLEHLNAFVKSARKSFPKSHKAFANRYLPVVDWENGDTSGYVLGEDGEFVDAFFMFEHELCNSQTSDVNDFMVPIADSLHAFLSP